MFAALVQLVSVAILVQILKIIFIGIGCNIVMQIICKLLKWKKKKKKFITTVYV